MTNITPIPPIPVAAPPALGGLTPFSLDYAQFGSILQGMDFRNRVDTIRGLQIALGLKSYARLHEIIKGSRRPSPALAIRIDEVTAGAIKRWELRPDLWTPTADA